MRSLLATIRRALAAALFVASAPALAGGIVPQQLILYKNPGAPLPQQIQPRWLAPANAYTSITVPANFDLLRSYGADVIYVEAQVVWQANSPAAYNGVGILLCPAQPQAGVELTGCGTLVYFSANDAGPAPYTPGCTSNPGGKFPCRINITTEFRNAMNSGWPVPLYIVGAAYGNGSTGPDIYDIEIHIFWGTP